MATADNNDFLVLPYDLIPAVSFKIKLSEPDSSWHFSGSSSRQRQKKSRDSRARARASSSRKKKQRMDESLEPRQSEKCGVEGGLKKG